MLNRIRKNQSYKQKPNLKEKNIYFFHIKFNIILSNWHHDFILSKAIALNNKFSKPVCKPNLWPVSSFQYWFWVEVPCGTIGKKKKRRHLTYLTTHRAFLTPAKRGFRYLIYFYFYFFFDKGIGYFGLSGNLFQRANFHNKYGILIIKS